MLFVNVPATAKLYTAYAPVDVPFRFAFLNLSFATARRARSRQSFGKCREILSDSRDAPGILFLRNIVPEEKKY